LPNPPSSWLKNWQWLEYLETDGSLRMFCKLCKGYFINLNDIDMKIIRQMKCVYFAAQKHISFNVYPDLYNLVSSSDDISSDPQILKISALISEKSSEYKGYGTYLNHVAARKFAMAIVHVIEEKLINEIKLAKNWSIMIDESNSINEKHLVIATQYMLLNVPVIRYMDVMILEDCRTEYIFEKLKNFIFNKDLNIENIAHFGSDGSKTGVSTRFNNSNPFMTSVHCIAHRLNLAGQDAAKEVPYFKEYES
ncbi:9180_t:CDS:2, partial [Gigaspora rosea]